MNEKSLHLSLGLQKACFIFLLNKNKKPFYKSQGENSELIFQYNSRNKFQYLALSCIGAIKQAVKSVERRLLLEFAL